MPRGSYHRGQTLLELITALFVLALVLVGALALTSSNFRLEGIGSSRLIATNLAREGVELARSVRDSNWLSGEVFDRGLINAKHCARIVGTAPQPFVDHFAFEDCVDTVDPLFLLTKTTDGRYYSDPAIGDPTQYYRRARLDPICLVNGVENILTQGACDDGTEIGVSVRVDVVWHYAGQKMNLSLAEHLYDWQ